MCPAPSAVKLPISTTYPPPAAPPFRRKAYCPFNTFSFPAPHVGSRMLKVKLSVPPGGLSAEVAVMVGVTPAGTEAGGVYVIVEVTVVPVTATAGEPSVPQAGEQLTPPAKSVQLTVLLGPESFRILAVMLAGVPISAVLNLVSRKINIEGRFGAAGSLASKNATDPDRVLSATEMALTLGVSYGAAGTAAGAVYGMVRLPTLTLVPVLVSVVYVGTVAAPSVPHGLRAHA